MVATGALVLAASGCARPPPPLPGLEGSSTSNDATGVDPTASPSTAAEETTSSAGVDTEDVPCGEGEVRCNGACIDPLSDSVYCGASDPCDESPGTSCAGSGTCQGGQCSGCTLVNDFEAPGAVNGWMTMGMPDSDWLIRLQSASSDLSAVTFTERGHVYGTDGNRDMPYPGDEAESSWASTPDITFGSSLVFLSWHVDEGGVGGYDNKTIDIDVGRGFEPLVDCFGGIGGAQPFCMPVLVARLGSDWDSIVIDTTEYAGMTGVLRFGFDAVSSMGTIEQGWYIDDIRVGDCG